MKITKEKAEADRKKPSSNFTLKLKTDWGYSSSEMRRISLDQWVRICGIINEKSA
jgi:hypothetical protein